MKYILDYDDFIETMINNEYLDLDEGIISNLKYHLASAKNKIKDHFVNNKGKYILGAAGLAAGGLLAPIGLLAGHLADRRPN